MIMPADADQRNIVRAKRRLRVGPLNSQQAGEGNLDG